MRNPAVVWEGIKNIFVEFSGRWIIVFEAIFLFIVIYYVLRTLQNNNAKRLIPVYTALVLLAGVICLFSEHLSVEVFYIFLMLTSLFFLLLFSIDIKRSIWNSNKRTGKTVSDVAAKKNGPNTVKADACIAAIVRAVQNLSKNNIGALIVFAVPDLVLKRIPVIGGIDGIAYIFTGVLIILVVMFYPSGVVGIGHDIKRLISRGRKGGAGNG